MSETSAGPDLSPILDLEIEDPRKIERLRAAAARSPDGERERIELGLALGDAGCTYESAILLRPLRKQWKTQPWADRAVTYLAVQTWWNKHTKAFIASRRAGRHHEALALLGDRIPLLWDVPGLLVHLGDIASERGELAVSNHFYERVHYLAKRGLPKINMDAFEYVAPASIIDNLMRAGNAKEALNRHARLQPNPGNAMAHEIQKAVLTTAAGDRDDAMRIVANMLLTAEKRRTGYGKTLRKQFIDSAQELDPLRARPDWTQMLDDPSGYLKARK